MVSLWILNKKISGSIVPGGRRAIREGPLAACHRATLRGDASEQTASSKTKRPDTTMEAPHRRFRSLTRAEINLPLFPEGLSRSGDGVMV